MRARGTKTASPVQNLLQKVQIKRCEKITRRELWAQSHASRWRQTCRYGVAPRGHRNWRTHESGLPPTNWKQYTGSARARWPT
jgi:hypothetical protein